MNKKPNVVFIMTDQHRFDVLGCMGNKVVKTPNLDKLASKSTVFDAAYTPCPVCAPARAAVFSGQYPDKCGVNSNWVPFDGSSILIPEQLKENGYTSGCVGKLHFVPHVKSWGFDFKELHDAPYSIYADDDKYSGYIKHLADIYGLEKANEFVRSFDEDESAYSENLEQFIMGRNFIQEEHHMVTWSANESIRFLQERDKSKPFMLYTGFFGPHHPWVAPEKWDIYNPDDIDVSDIDLDYSDKPIIQKSHLKAIENNRELFSESDYQRIIAAYYGQVTMIDHYIGKIFDELKQQGLWDDTIIVFTADHGDHNGHFGLFFKCTMLESAARVPLIIKPAGTSEMKRIDVPVSTLDIYGTIMEAAEVNHWQYPHIDSGSLAKFVDIESGLEPSPCFSKLNKMSMLRKGDLKLSRFNISDEECLHELYRLKENQLEGDNIFDTIEDTELRDSMIQELDDLVNDNQRPSAAMWRK
jgi:arylsulfatase